MKNKIIKNNKGFTLIELLAVILVLALIVVIATGGIGKLFELVGVKANRISEVSIKNAASLYAKEDNSSEEGNRWMKPEDFTLLDSKGNPINVNNEDEKYLYFCTSIQELINKGLIDKDADLPKKEEIQILKTTVAYVAKNRDTFVSKNPVLCYTIDQDFGCRFCSSVLEQNNPVDPSVDPPVNPPVDPPEEQNGYKIKYYSNVNDSSVNLSSMPTEQQKEKNVDILLSSKKPTREGYTFISWNTKSDGSGTSYSISQNYSGNADLNLYAQWQANYVVIRFKTSGGTVIQNSSNYGQSSDGFVTKNGSVLETTLSYKESLGQSGLLNYNNQYYLNIKKEGRSVTAGKEWVCLEGECKDKTYDHDAIYKGSDFCDASVNSCNVVLGVRWVLNTVTIHYRTGGGTLSQASINNGFNVNGSGNITRNGTVVSHTVRYNENTIRALDESVMSGGLLDYNGSMLNITRSMYNVPSGSEWIKVACESGSCKNGPFDQNASTISYNNFCDLSNGSCTIALAPNWILTNHTNHHWNARGAQLVNVGFSWSSNPARDNCKNQTQGYIIYCSDCGMSKVYYRNHVHDDGTGTLVCPSCFGYFGKSGCTDWNIVFDDRPYVSNQSSGYSVDARNKMNGEINMTVLCDGRNGTACSY